MTVPAAELRLLEGFEITVADRPTALPLSCQRLLAFVALTPRPPQRAYVARRLWPNSTEEGAAANLRSALWRVRRQAVPLVESTGRRLRLGSVRTDVADTAKALTEALTGEVSTARLGRLPLTAELLPDWPDDWVEAERKRYRQLGFHALEAIARRLIGDRRYGSAIEVAQMVVAAEPLRASTRRLLIQAHLAEGNRGEALREYDRYRILLHRRLGLEPPVDLATLIPPADGDMA
jgi:DNA-binding SARP family transcriptional activator